MRRTVIVGDVHGCRDELESLLDKIALSKNDRLIFTGDLVSRGPDPRGVIGIARKTGAWVVRGNHEHRLIAQKNDPTLQEEDWQLLESSRLWIELPEFKACVVHAGILPGTPIEKQDPRILMTIRSLDPNGHPSSIRSSDDRLWGAFYTGPPHIFFGHNALSKPQFHPWATGIDTGCVYGGELTALILPDESEIPRGSDVQALLVSQKAFKTYFSKNR